MSIALDMCIGPFPATLHGPTKPLYGIERVCPAVHGVEIWHENNLVVAQISAGRGNGNGNGNVGDNNGNGNSGNNNGNWNTGDNNGNCFSNDGNENGQQSFDYQDYKKFMKELERCGAMRSRNPE